MRSIEFKMELENENIHVGAQVEVEESELQDGLIVYYTIIPAVAMSGNFRKQDALKVLTGTVSGVRPGSGGAYYVTVDFED